MRNGGKRLFSTFASSIVLAASALIATPAPAQTGGGSGENYYGCNDITSGGYGTYPWGYGCCQYDAYSGGWYRMYVTHWEPCTGPYGQTPEEPDDDAEEPAEPAGR